MPKCGFNKVAKMAASVFLDTYQTVIANLKILKYALK